MYLVIWISVSLVFVMAVAAVVDMIAGRSGRRSCCRFVANFNLRFVYMLFFEFFLCGTLHMVSK